MKGDFTVPFYMGELFAGSVGMDCEGRKDCRGKSNVVHLRKAEVKMINAAFPDEVKDGMARGPGAAGMIIKEKLGKVICDRCPK